MSKSTYRISMALVVAMMLSAWSGTATPADAKAAANRRPNILILLADDMGFSDIGCYGGEISTPNIDKLAASGLRYTQFYNTTRCWTTRSSLLTGYYSQEVRGEVAKQRLPQWARLIPQYLKPLGYRCYHSGKWHILGAPLAVAEAGFDHSYMLLDHNRHFNPQHHTLDDKPLPPVKPGSGYYTTTEIATRAIDFLKEHAEKHSGEPFFEYVAFTCPHFPVQAPAEDVARYRDRYTVGWDVIRQQRWERLKQMGIVTCALSARDPSFTPRYFKPQYLKDLGEGEVEHPVAWDDLTAVQKEFQASKMAVHAAMVDRMDQEIGRIVQQLRDMHAFDNTVIFVLSDNGADASIIVRGDGNDKLAAPGTAETFRCIGPGWATASNTPFRLHKIWVHEGGISTPLVVHWPDGIAAQGQLRHDVGHVIDLVPTILDLCGTTASKKWHGVSVPPLPGMSLVPSFAHDDVLKRKELFFKHEGNRAIRMGNWKLVSSRENGNKWELYDLATDRCEQVNLAGKQPERVKEMAARWKHFDEQYDKLGKSP